MSPIDPACSPLVSPADLADLLVLDAPARPVVLDIRYPGVGSTEDGYAQYRAGHVPEAVYVSLDDVLAAPHEPGVTGRHPLPSVEVFEAGMRAAGVSDDRPVVVYDDWMSIAAARAWWLLRYFGHEDVRVLDGGWKAWHDGGYATASGDTLVEPGAFTATPGHRTLVGADEAGRIGESGVLVDARPANRYRGEDETIDPVAGHIPGAVSLPAMDLVDGDGRLLPAAELEQRLHDVGVADGAVVGIYCGSGVQACHVALAGSASGILHDPAIYAGSWSEWITDTSRPVELG